MNVNDVIKNADPKSEFISIEKGDVGLVMVFDHTALVKKNERKIKRLYTLDEDGETVNPIDVKAVITKLVEAVENNVDVTELLEEVFSNSPPDLLLKTYSKLLEDADGVPIEVSSNPTYHCCYSIIFGDKTKPGHIEIPISGGRYDRGI